MSKQVDPDAASTPVRPDPSKQTQPRWETEEDLIQSLFAPLSSGFPGAFGLLDDAALLTPLDGHGIVVSTDNIVAGLHLPPTADPYDVAWKALAVNVSDVVAKGATPIAYTLTLMLPSALDSAWLERLCEGLNDAQTKFGVHLAGGDTDRARHIQVPAYTVGITMFGVTPANAFTQRTTANPDELIIVTGTIGDAALGLRLETSADTCTQWSLAIGAREKLLARYLRPTPSVDLAPVIADYATAAIDISDGLIKDVERLCRTSGVGARIEADAVPISLAARGLINAGMVSLADLLTGGEDYCVVLTLPPDKMKAFRLAAEDAGACAVRIGRTHTDAGDFQVIDSQGRALSFESSGWDHLQKP
ncbi:MAG: thiamine-phosphate kinase [Pseudomonadota bacterium]